LVASVRIFSRSERALHNASSRSMRAVQTRSRLERRAGSGLVLSGSSSRKTTARYTNQPSGVESAASLPELVELGVHPIEDVVFVMGAALELLSPTTRNP
jgi:hypothetical protein